MARHNWTDDLSGPSTRVKRLEADIRQILRRTDPTKLERQYREALADLRQNLVDIRIYVNAYEFSEERPQQEENAKVAQKWLAKAHGNILKSSEAHVFSAIDVAQLSAQIEQISGDLK